MYAILEIAGQQFKVAKDQKVFVHRLPEDEGSKVSFDRVLLVGDGDNIILGAPAIDGAQVGAQVLRHTTLSETHTFHTHTQYTPVIHGSSSGC